MDCGSPTELRAIEIRVKSGVSNTIGSVHNQTPVLEQKRNALQDRLIALDNVKNPLKKDKKDILKQIKSIQKEIKLEKPRYKAHKELHEFISNHVLKLSAATGFAVDPAEYLIVLNSMSRKLFNLPFVNMNNAHPSTIRAFHNLFKKWSDKADKNKEFNIFNKSFQDIWKMVATHDKSGLGFKTVELSATIPDATWNSSFAFLDEHDGFTAGIDQNVEDHTSSDFYEDALFRNHDEIYVDDDGKPVVGRKFSEFSVKQQLDMLQNDYRELIRHLMDGRIRYIVPKLIPVDKEAYQEFGNTDDHEAVSNYIKWGENHRFHNVIGKDGKRYTFAMVKQEEGHPDGEQYNSYLVSRASKDEETGGWMADRRYATNGYGDETLVVSGLDEGFWEASEDRPFNYPMRNKRGDIENTNVKTYYNFSRMLKQPNENIVNEVKFKKGGKTNAKSVWSAVAGYRGMLSRMFTLMKSMFGDYDIQLNSLIKEVRINFIDNMGFSPESAQILIDESIAHAGIEVNVWQSDRTNKIYTGNSFMSKVEKNYDPNIFDVTVGWGFIDKAMGDLNSEIKQVGVDIGELRNTVAVRRKEVAEGYTKYSIDDNEFLDAMAELKFKEKQLNKAKEELSHFKQMQDVDKSPTAQDILQHRLVRRIAYTKHRKPFTDAMQRNADPSAISKYIGDTFKGLHYNILTLNLLKTLAKVDNPEVAEWLINRVKIATGSLDYNANFLGLDISNRNMAAGLNKVAKKVGKKGEWKPEDVHYWGTGFNMWASGNLLGMWASLNNNTQRIAMIEEFGWNYTKRAWDIMNDPNFLDSDIYRAVQNSGVLDLINHFSDMLVGERGIQIGIVSHRIKPNLAFTEVQLAKSKFMRQKTSVFDVLLKDISGLTKRQKLHVKAMKEYTKEEAVLELHKKRGQLWDVLRAEKLGETKRRLKILNRSLTHEEIGKLATWKLRWLPGNLDNKWLTFSGGELDMRIQADIIGFLMAEDMGLLNEELDIPKYEQQPAVDAGRMSVYNTMFGMSLQWLPEGFGGGGKQAFQYKPYTYHEMIREHRIMENFFAGNVKSLGGFRRIASAFMSQFKKGTKYGDKRDEFAIRAVRLMEGRGLMTMAMNIMLFSPGLSAFSSLMRKIYTGSPLKKLPFLPGIAVRGYKSPWVDMAMKVILTGMMMGGFLHRLKDKKEKEWWNDIKFLIFPPLISWMFNLSQGRQAFKPWIPLQEVVDPVISIAEELLD